MRKLQGFDRILSGLLFLAILSGCSALSNAPQSDLSSLQQGLQNRFGEQNVSLTINNGNMLMISLVNSVSTQLAPKDQEKKAHDIALFITQNYKPIHQIKNIWITFSFRRTLFNIFDYPTGLESFMYDRREFLPDVYPPTSDGFKTIFVFHEPAGIAAQNWNYLDFAGPAILAGGILWLLFAIFLAWKTKRRIFLILGAGSILSLCFGMPFTLIPRGVQQSQSKEYQRLEQIYNQQQYQVAEGTVHVLHEQPRSGHAEGDIITLGNEQFTIDYYTTNLGYDQTIAWGGALKEGTYARIFYDGDTILRVDVKSP